MIFLLALFAILGAGTLGGFFIGWAAGQRDLADTIGAHTATRLQAFNITPEEWMSCTRRPREMRN